MSILIHILTVSYEDDVHEQSVDDLHQAILESGVPFLSLDAAKAAVIEEVRSQLEDMTEDDFETDEEAAIFTDPNWEPTWEVYDTSEVEGPLPLPNGWIGSVDTFIQPTGETWRIRSYQLS